MRARAVLVACATWAVLGCASTPSTQTLEVLVHADDNAWSGPLPCKAANSAGEWQFTAPGSVTVRPSITPLRVSCTMPAGTSAEPSATPSRPGAAAREHARQGAKVGGGAGAALGIAAAPIMGPAFAVLLAVGSAFRGAEIGGLVGAVSSGGAWEYPSPITLRITAAAAQQGSTR